MEGDASHTAKSVVTNPGWPKLPMGPFLELSNFLAPRSQAFDFPATQICCEVKIDRADYLAARDQFCYVACLSDIQRTVSHSVFSLL